MNKNLIKVLKELNPVSDKVFLKYPKTVLVSDAMDMLALIDCEKLGCSEFEETGIYELAKFNALLGMFDDFEITKNNNELKIESKLNSAVFCLADPVLLSSYDKDPAIFERIESADKIAEFKLEMHNIQNLKKSIGIFGDLNSISFESKDGNVDVFLSKINRFASSNNTYKIAIPRVSDKNFELKIGTDNFIKLPNNEYTVKVFYNQEKDQYRIMFETDNFKLVIATLSE